MHSCTDITLNTLPVVAVRVNVCTRTQHRRDKKDPKRAPQKSQLLNCPYSVLSKVPVSNQDQASHCMSRVINLVLLLVCYIVPTDIFCAEPPTPAALHFLLLKKISNFQCSPASIFCWNKGDLEALCTWAVHLWNKLQPPSHCEKRQISELWDYGISWKCNTNSLPISSTGMNWGKLLWQYYLIWVRALRYIVQAIFHINISHGSLFVWRL